MALVTQICDYIYVLDFGKPIFDGTVEEVMSSEVVQAAYLGDGQGEAEGAPTSRGTATGTRS